MKIFLTILIIAYLFSYQAFSNEFYLKGKTPKDFMNDGYKLFSVTFADRDNYDVAYTFIKNTKIVTCRVKLDSSAGRKPAARHRCYLITN